MTLDWHAFISFLVGTGWGVLVGVSIKRGAGAAACDGHVGDSDSEPEGERP